MLSTLLSIPSNSNSLLNPANGSYFAFGPATQKDRCLCAQQAACGTRGNGRSCGDRRRAIVGQYVVKQTEFARGRQKGARTQQHARCLPMSAQFNIRAADPASVSLLESELGLPRFIAAADARRAAASAAPDDARRIPQPLAGTRLAGPLHHSRPARGGRRVGSGHARRQAHRGVRRLRPGRHIGHHGAHAGPAHAGRPCHAVHPAALRGRLRPDRGRVRAHAGAESGIHRDRGLRHRL